MYKLAAGTAFCLLSVLFSFAQDPPPPTPARQQPVSEAPQPPPCPKLEVKASGQLIRDGQPARFTATLAGLDTKTHPTFMWSISSGTMRSGQGTTSIDVDTTGAGEDRGVTATILVGGLSGECEYQASATIVVAGAAKKLDTFATLPEKEETERIDAFLENISQADQAYIVVYAGRNTVRGYANNSIRRIRAHALKSGISAERLVTIDGGYREEPTHELWLVPIGSEAPRPSPTINARDIVFPKTTPAKPTTPAKKP